jgi:hypothetical protein
MSPVVSPWKTCAKLCWKAGWNFAGLPGGGSAEEDAVPVHVGEGFAVVVPESVELARAP